MTTTVTEKGQITIPASLRKHFGLRKGSRCAFMVRENELVLVPIKKQMDLEEYRALFKEGLTDSGSFDQRKSLEKSLER
jgi:AbrB family looped-hinge helix DNA binding protein